MGDLSWTTNYGRECLVQKQQNDSKQTKYLVLLCEMSFLKLIFREYKAKVFYLFNSGKVPSKEDICL